MDEEQADEGVVEKEVDMEKDAAGKTEKPDKNIEKNRPRSATKLEKERQNRLCRAQKQAERIKDVTKEEKSENVENEVIEEKAEVEGMETKKVEMRKDSEESSSQWETESEVVEEDERKREVSVDEVEKKDDDKEEKEEKNEEKEMREETKRLAAKIRSAGRRNRRKSSKGGR